MQARVRPFVVLLSGTVVAFAVYAALAWVAHSTWPKLPRQGLEHRPFIVSRDPDNPLVVRRGAPHVVPQLYADARLTCSVELPADYDLDIVVRRVEPVIGDRGRFESYHGRFVVLRLSGTSGDLGALGDGPVLRSRTQALFEHFESPGLPLRAGQQATVSIEARGSTVTANVAGRGGYAIEADDPYGAFAFVARPRLPAGEIVTASELPPVVIRELRIDLLDPPDVDPLSNSMMFGLAALGLGFAVAVASGLVRSLAAALCLLGGAGLGASVLTASLQVGAFPTTWGTVLLSLWAAPVAMAVLVPRAMIRTVTLGLVASGVLFEIGLQREFPRLEASVDRRLDAWFGQKSGGAAFDALAERTRLRRRGYVGPVPNREGTRRVAFLGGALLFESAPEFAFDLAPYACHLASAGDRKIEALAFPTALGDCVQQFRLFRRYYTEPPPDLLVVGVAESDALAADARQPAWTVGIDDEPPRRPWSLAFSLLADALGQRSAAVDLAATARMFDELADVAASRQIPVLVLDNPALPEDWRSAVRAAAENHRFAVIHGVLGSSPKEGAAVLAATIARRIE